MRTAPGADQLPALYVSAAQRIEWNTLVLPTTLAAFRYGAPLGAVVRSHKRIPGGLRHSICCRRTSRHVLSGNFRHDAAEFLIQSLLSTDRMTYGGWQTLPSNARQCDAFACIFHRYPKTRSEDGRK